MFYSSSFEAIKNHAICDLTVNIVMLYNVIFIVTLNGLKPSPLGEKDFSPIFFA
jgi:hypothetical protein